MSELNFKHFYYQKKHKQYNLAIIHLWPFVLMEVGNPTHTHI